MLRKVLILMLLASQAFAVPVGLHWSAPSTGEPVAEYLVEISTDGGPYVLMATVPDTTAIVDVPLHSTIVARVAGRDVFERIGPWSIPSEEHLVTLGAPGQPGQVVFD